MSEYSNFYTACGLMLIIIVPIISFIAVLNCLGDFNCRYQIDYKYRSPSDNATNGGSGNPCDLPFAVSIWRSCK